MAARLTRARKSLADERVRRCPPAPSSSAGGARGGRRLPRLHRRLRARRPAPEVVRTDLAGRGDPAGPAAARRCCPGRADLDGLLALMLLQHSRRDARVRDGRLVLLPDQDRGPLARRRDRRGAGPAHARSSAAPGTPYLLQALIAAEHAIAPHPDATDWPRIVARYDELEALSGSPVVRLNRAVAVAEADGPLAGLRALDGLGLPGPPAARRPGPSCWPGSAGTDEARTAYDGRSSAAATRPSAPT